jgi:hypothetical protein
MKRVLIALTALCTVAGSATAFADKDASEGKDNFFKRAATVFAHDAKTGGKQAGKAFKELGQDIGHGSKKAAKDIGQGMKESAQRTSKAAKELAK